MYKQGDIILIPYPFTDLSSTKQRPAVVISNAKSNLSMGNYIVAKVTSVIRKDDFSFDLKNADLDTSLPKASQVRTNELFTVSDSIVRKRIATLKSSSVMRLIEAVKDNLD